MLEPQLTRAQPAYQRVLQCCQPQLCHHQLKGPDIHTPRCGQSPVRDALGKALPQVRWLSAAGADSAEQWVAICCLHTTVGRYVFP